MLLDLGWQPDSPAEWHAPNGTTFNFGARKPYFTVLSRLREALADSIVAGQMRAAAGDNPQLAGLLLKPDLDAMHLHYSNLVKGGKHAEATCYLRVVAGGEWNNAKKARCNSIESDACNCCGSGQPQTKATCPL